MVQFGPKEEDNFIKNIATNKKVQMVRKGGSYVIPADFIAPEEDCHRQAVSRR